ncbi:MAG: hypothetical protein GF341_11015 [candidate division Zixibacteria bacterium]|nr:hypothetical protein [candidate division Zixibacteria bacterium]
MASTAQVTVRFKSTTRVYAVGIDMNKLKFRSGTAKTNVTVGDRHVLQWVVRGVPGTKFEVSIQADKGFVVLPKKVFSKPIKKTISQSKIKTGSVLFKVGVDKD